MNNETHYTILHTLSSCEGKLLFTLLKRNWTFEYLHGYYYETYCFQLIKI